MKPIAPLAPADPRGCERGRRRRQLHPTSPARILEERILEGRGFSPPLPAMGCGRSSSGSRKVMLGGSGSPRLACNPHPPLPLSFVPSPAVRPLRPPLELFPAARALPPGPRARPSASPNFGLLVPPSAQPPPPPPPAPRRSPFPALLARAGCQESGTPAAKGPAKGGRAVQTAPFLPRDTLRMEPAGLDWRGEGCRFCPDGAFPLPTSQGGTPRVGGGGGVRGPHCVDASSEWSWVVAVPPLFHGASCGQDFPPDGAWRIMGGGAWKGGGA